MGLGDGVPDGQKKKEGKKKMLGWLDGPLSVSKNMQGCPCSFKVQQALFFFFCVVGVPFFVPLVFNEF
jgi:hypothetical protein